MFAGSQINWLRCLSWIFESVDNEIGEQRQYYVCLLPEIASISCIQLLLLCRRWCFERGNMCACNRAFCRDKRGHNNDYIAFVRLFCIIRFHTFYLFWTQKSIYFFLLQMKYIFSINTKHSKTSSNKTNRTWFSPSVNSDKSAHPRSWCSSALFIN